MINPATEAIHSATYVDNYIDSVENLPDDIQRHLSRIRDIDVQYRGHLREVDHYYDLWKSMQNAADISNNRKTRAILRMQQNLIQAQELGDEKMQIVNILQELIDLKTRQLDIDQKNLDIKEDLQQHRIDSSQQMDDSSPIPTKQLRTHSPIRGDSAITSSSSNERQNSNTSSKDNNSNTFSNIGRNFNDVGNIETTANSGISNGVLITNGNSTGTLNNSNTNKRSRRRHESHVNNNNGVMEFGGNESNSANEGGSNGGSERHSSQLRSTIISGSTQKKNSTQNQIGSGGVGSASSTSGTATNSSSSNTGNGSGKKKKRKARGTQSTSAQLVNTREETPPPDPIDPDEPTYCVCNQISFGEMILCDNDLCPIEWFHFSCVSLVLKPKGKWYCPNCRGERQNIMKPKAQFLKELERYNKEKEEKT
ncbi:inhibitor of growth protein 1 [Teleopsis dalmanni]|uniref:inhibitor of growth protein 1 n=1 Tax=Teleopsis dalmanni TaxID=139649 RepID=UPI000D32C838|nr:inhibitor of growth protein 1 [Teleopsis dalmanni]XP_037947568.1 inhibitor of growth protein 1 [Teleopsis dalmanni]